MSIKQASSIYKSFSDDQKKLIDEKMISATLPVKHWMGFLKKAAAYDELGEKAARQYLIYMIILIVLDVVSLVIIADYWQVGVPLFVVVSALLVFVIMNYRKFIRRDLTNHLRLFLLPLLVVLKDKAGEKAKLSMNLDLRNPLRTEPVKIYQQDNRKIKLFEPKYVIGKIKLLDEASNRIAVTRNLKS